MKPSEGEFIARARDLVPGVRASAQRTARERRIPAETDRALRDAGFYRAFQPEAFDGFELSFGLHVELAAEIGRGCPATAGFLGITMANAWLFGMFPAAAQVALWQGAATASLALALFSAGASAVREDDGVRLSGHWDAPAGAEHAEAAIVLASVPDLIFAFVPRGAYRVEDERIAVDDRYVPAEHLLLVSRTATGATPGGHHNAGYLYRLPFFALAGHGAIGASFGAVAAALEKRELGRDDLRVGEARAGLDAARTRVLADHAAINASGAAGHVPDRQQRIAYRRHVEHAAGLCVQAMERIGTPTRDVQAVSDHLGRVAGIVPDERI